MPARWEAGSRGPHAAGRGGAPAAGQLGARPPLCPARQPAVTASGELRAMISQDDEAPASSGGLPGSEEPSPAGAAPRLSKSRKRELVSTGTQRMSGSMARHSSRVSGPAGRVDRVSGAVAASSGAIRRLSSVSGAAGAPGEPAQVGRPLATLSTLACLALALAAL